MIFTGETADGVVTRYNDGKRHFYIFSLFLPVVPLFAISLYYASGENPLATLIPLFFIFGFVPLADAVLGEDRHNPPPEVVAAMDADPYYRRLAMAAVPIFWASYIATAAFVGSAALPLWSLVALAIGVGTINGGCISVGHELGHKQDPRSRLFGALANNVVGYAHFRVEHNRGHHTYVSTPEDPASSRLGESIYAFALRELPGAFKRGWRNEAERLAKRGKRAWSPENEILRGFALTLAVAGALIALFGWTVAPFILAHHFFGWYGLTQANYVEHYGLLRRKLPNGRYEPVQPRHSWNTNHIFSNLITFHLQRHSEHHANPLRPYQSLRHFEHLPQLPSGYPGCYVLAAVPPLWFKVMNPKVLAWAGGDVEKTNATPRARGRLASLGMPA